MKKKEHKKGKGGKKDHKHKKGEKSNASSPITELSSTVRNFFADLLDIKYQFTYDELNQELFNHNLDWKFRAQIDKFFKRLSEMEFSGRELTEKDIISAAREAESIIKRLSGYIEERPASRAAEWGKEGVFTKIKRITGINMNIHRKRGAFPDRADTVEGKVSAAIGLHKLAADHDEHQSEAAHTKPRAPSPPPSPPPESPPEPPVPPPTHPKHSKHSRHPKHPVTMESRHTALDSSEPPPPPPYSGGNGKAGGNGHAKRHNHSHNLRHDHEHTSERDPGHLHGRINHHGIPKKSGGRLGHKLSRIKRSVKRVRHVAPVLRGPVTPVKATKPARAKLPSEVSVEGIISNPGAYAGNTIRMVGDIKFVNRIVERTDFWYMFKDTTGNIVAVSKKTDKYSGRGTIRGIVKKTLTGEAFIEIESFN